MRTKPSNFRVCFYEPQKKVGQEFLNFLSTTNHSKMIWLSGAEPKPNDGMSEALTDLFQLKTPPFLE